MLRGVRVQKCVANTLALALLLTSFFVQAQVPSAHAQGGTLPDRCGAKSDLVVKFKSVSIRNSPSGGKLGVSFDVTVTHPPVDDQRGRTLIMAFYEKEGSRDWTAIASSSTAISAPLTITPRVIDNGTTSQVSGFRRGFSQEPSTADFRYAVYAYFGDNTNPNCSGPHIVNLSYQGEDEGKAVPPCPTNVHPIKTADLGETNVEFQQVMLAWDFSWSNQPPDAAIVYKYSIATESNNSSFFRPDEFTEKQALIQFLDPNGGKNTITIYALNKTSNKLSTGCKPVVFQNTQAGGPYIWIDQDGNTHNVSAGEFANVINPNDDSCSLTWIISGDGNWLNPFDDGAPEVLKRLNIDGKKLNPFSRMSVCLYLWTVYPITKWASELIIDVGGIAVLNQKAKWHA